MLSIMSFKAKVVLKLGLDLLIYRFSAPWNVNKSNKFGKCCTSYLFLETHNVISNINGFEKSRRKETCLSC